MNLTESLRILLVCEDIPQPALGGLGRHVVALANALLLDGHSVTIMGRDWPHYDNCADEVGFEGRFITGCGNPSRGWKESQLGIFNPLRRPSIARGIAKAIVVHATEYDVVHYHGHFPLVGRYIPKSIAFLQTRHDQGSECVIHSRFRNGQICKLVDPRACAGCAHAKPGPIRTAISASAVRRYRQETAEAFENHSVIFVSKFLLDRYRTVMPKVRLDNAIILHNFVDEKFLAGIPNRAGGDTTSIYVAGRLDAAKGIVELLEVLERKLPDDWVVNVYGDGPLRAHLRRQYENSRSIYFRGHVSSQIALTAMKQSNLVVMPSLWEEAFGLVTLEALRLGKVCYALRRGATPELASYGAKGQLRLFDTLSELVDGLVVEAAGAQTATAAGGTSADVSVRLPELLALYRLHAKGLVPSMIKDTASG